MLVAVMATREKIPGYIDGGSQGRFAKKAAGYKSEAPPPQIKLMITKQNNVIAKIRRSTTQRTNNSQLHHGTQLHFAWSCQPPLSDLQIRQVPFCLSDSPKFYDYAFDFHPVGYSSGEVAVHLLVRPTKPTNVRSNNLFVPANPRQLLAIFVGCIYIALRA
ncbi:hypothetical protein BDFG_03169 [Blastomyces dermatitidis ATCC 26199]|nr:hypothetical protein BDFG_03169 [Blastomyces dermatitidis ATCC 26199]